MSSPHPTGRPRVQRIAEAAVERARLSVVPRVVPSRAPRVPFVTLVSLVLLGGVVGLLMFNTTMQQNAFAATALEQKAADLSSRKQTLRMELELLRDPQRVAERAQELGMVPAPSPAFLRITDGKVLGVPTVATREGAFDIRPTPPRKPAVLTPAPIVIEVPARHRGRDRAGERGRDARAAAAERNAARRDTARRSGRDTERTPRLGAARNRGDRSPR